MEDGQPVDQPERDWPKRRGMSLPTEMQLRLRYDVFSDVNQEIQRQKDKYPTDSVSKIGQVAEASPLSVLVEEVGEVARAINDGEPLEQVERELVQVAAVAFAWIERIRRPAWAESWLNEGDDV